MKRKTYSIQSAAGHNATKFAWNSARLHAQSLAIEWFQALGVAGPLQVTIEHVEKTDGQHTHIAQQFHCAGKSICFVINRTN